MKKRVNFRAYKDHLILEADFSYCTVDEMMAAVDELGETLAEQSEGSTLVLKNVEGVRVDIRVINTLCAVFWGRACSGGGDCSLIN